MAGSKGTSIGSNISDSFPTTFVAPVRSRWIWADFGSGQKWRWILRPDVQHPFVDAADQVTAVDTTGSRQHRLQRRRGAAGALPGSECPPGAQGVRMGGRGCG